MYYFTIIVSLFVTQLLVDKIMVNTKQTTNGRKIEKEVEDTRSILFGPILSSFAAIILFILFLNERLIKVDNFNNLGVVVLSFLTPIVFGFVFMKLLKKEKLTTMFRVMFIFSFFILLLIGVTLGLNLINENSYIMFIPRVIVYFIQSLFAVAIFTFVINSVGIVKKVDNAKDFKEVYRFIYKGSKLSIILMILLLLTKSIIGYTPLVIHPMSIIVGRYIFNYLRVMTLFFLALKSGVKYFPHQAL